MTVLIVLLTALIVVDCLVLVLLVLMQLPKKEAGAGLAFGGAATDTLFGAGSGNLLTKATKYAAGIFFGGALILSILLSHRNSENDTEFQRSLEQQVQQGAPTEPPVTPTMPAPSGQPLTTSVSTNTSVPPLTTAPAPATNTSPAPR